LLADFGCEAIFDGQAAIGSVEEWRNKVAIENRSKIIPILKIRSKVFVDADRACKER